MRLFEAIRTHSESRISFLILLHPFLLVLILLAAVLLITYWPGRTLMRVGAGEGASRPDRATAEVSGS